MASQTYGYVDAIYNEGDKVLFKEKETKWSGPGVVRGKEGTKIKIIWLCN